MGSTGKALIVVSIFLLVGLIYVYQNNSINDFIQKNQRLQFETKKKAQLTWYMSYPRCCKESPDYDPNWPKDECEDYSGCEYLGQFACLDGQKSFNWVKSHNIISFYDDSDPSGKNFQKKWCNKQIRLYKNGKVFNATILDTCGNEDCDYCCRKNSKGGYLIDLEYHTAEKNIGGISHAEGTIDFELLSSDEIQII